MDESVTWVTSPAAIARNDQYGAHIKDNIRAMDKETHHILALRILQERELAHDRSTEQIIRDIESDPIGVLVRIISANAALYMLNEVAIEKWGINGTEVGK